MNLEQMEGNCFAHGESVPGNDRQRAFLLHVLSCLGSIISCFKVHFLVAGRGKSPSEM